MLFTNLFHDIFFNRKINSKFHNHFFSFANSLQQGAIKKVNTSKLAFKQMENIGFFLTFIENAGEVPKTELFQTADLYEAQDPNSVAVALASLARKVRTLTLIHNHFISNPFHLFILTTKI